MRNHLRWLFLFLMGVALIGCQDDLNVNSPVNNQSSSGFGLNKSSAAIEDLTSDLTPIGSDILVAGTGTSVTGAGTISLNVPNSAIIKNVYLYWEGRHRTTGIFPDGDSQIKVNGTAIDGELVGKSNVEGKQRCFVFRADITSRGFVSNGANTLSVSEFVAPNTWDDDLDRPDGVGVLVVIEDGPLAKLEIKDGSDWAYYASNASYPHLLVTKQQTFSFEPYPIERKANLMLFIADIGVSNGTGLPHHLEISVGGSLQSYNIPFSNSDGGQWDTYVKEVTIPAGVTDVKVQLFSDAPVNVQDGSSSLDWLLAALKVPTPLGKIGDFVWEDTNKNGIQDDGEKGIQNVTVELYDCATPANLLKTTTTDANGYYSFEALQAGSYKIKFITPSGYTPTLANVDGDLKDSDLETGGFTTCIDLTAGEVDLSWDAGFYKTPPALSGIGDKVWKDLDGDGIQEDGEPGFEGVKVELYTCAGVLVDTKYTNTEGNYLFSDLTPGSYFLQFYTPDGWAITVQDAVGSTAETDSDIFPENGKTVCTDLSAGEVDLRWDAGYVQLEQKSKLGDFVWNDVNMNGIQDNGELGIPEIKVDLLDCSGNLITSTTTNAMGYYSFDNLAAGEYKVKFTLPAGYAFSPKDAGSDNAKDSDAGLDGVSDCITLAAGVEDLTWDAGMYLVLLNKIGDFVWHDKDVDGIQDANEPGIKDVVVELLSGNVVIKTTTTDDNGKYLFTDLANGNYCVRVAASNYEVGGVLYSTAQTKWYATKKNQGADDAKDSDANKNESVCTTLNNNDDLTLDFGFYKTCVSVTKLANKTTAKPGETITYTFVVENCGDITLGGGVDLFDAMLNPTAPHKIGNLTPVYPGTTKTLTKTYCVTTKDCGDLVNVVKAVGHPVDGSANVEFTASVIVKIDCPPAPAKLGDKVWFDKDNDGVQDSDESGIKDIKVELLDCSGKLVATTYTNYYGLYYFTNVTPGDYKVKFYAPTGYGFTKKDQGTNDAKDSDADQSTGITTCLTLTSGQTDLSWDAGLICLPKSKLGDKVWLDKDKDGIQDSGEPGVKSVKVQLYSSSGSLLNTTYTDYNGNYYFSNLNAGSYKIKFNLPSGHAFTKKDQGSNDEKDSDADLETGYTVTINLAAGVTDLKWDAGLVQKSSCFSPDYWKKHTKYYPSNPYDHTWKQCGSKGEDTDFFKCGTSWYKVLCSTDNDAYYKLSHQLIAAKLNMLWGAHTSGDCKNAIRDAEDLLNKYTPSYIRSLSSSHSLKVKFSNLASFLGKCNND